VFVTNHVLSGVAIGRALQRKPVTAFFVGMGSHLVLDAVPHWGCEGHGPEREERFRLAARRDGLLGLATMAAATLLVGKPERTATVAAMAGAVLLDLDKPVEHFLGWKPFPAAVRRLHGRVQNESPDGLAKEIAYGVALATVDAACIRR
jgi:hypothetical protein